MIKDLNTPKEFSVKIRKLCDEYNVIDYVFVSVNIHDRSAWSGSIGRKGKDHSNVTRKERVCGLLDSVKLNILLSLEEQEKQEEQENT